MTRQILHIVPYDKFTAGYINFMKMYMKHYEHVFFVNEKGKESFIERNLCDGKNVVKYSDDKELIFDYKKRLSIKKADKIIVSGIFGVEKIIFYWTKSVLQKTYFHFWGDDFYQVRNRIPLSAIMASVNRYKLLSCFKRIRGVLFLIDGEYEKFVTITNIKKQHVFVAMMPRDPFKEEFEFDKFIDVEVRRPIKLVIGNSATRPNNHVDALKKLEHLRNEEIEIYCPLSYGEEEYAKTVIQTGNELFGEKFHAITEWMELNDFYAFLASCHIGIYNNDRQQALGNIVAMIRTGKKIYMRTNTTMYDDFIKRGYIINDVNSLEFIDMDQLIEFPERESNLKIAEEWKKENCMRKTEKEWEKVFSD